MEKKPPRNPRWVAFESTKPDTVNAFRFMLWMRDRRREYCREKGFDEDAFRHHLAHGGDEYTEWITTRAEELNHAQEATESDH